MSESQDKSPTSLLSETAVAVGSQLSRTPLRNGEYANAVSVTIESDSYPNSEIKEVNSIQVTDAANSGLGVTFEYDEQRKTLDIVLGNKEQLGNVKRRRRMRWEDLRTHCKWAKRVIFGSWDRDLEKWADEDKTREARSMLAGAPGQMGGDSQSEDYELGVEFQAGRRVDYLEVWRARVYWWSRLLEFVCLGVPVVIAFLDVELRVGLPISLVLFASAWFLDDVKSKNRKWKARLGSRSG